MRREYICGQLGFGPAWHIEDWRKLRVFKLYPVWKWSVRSMSVDKYHAALTLPVTKPVLIKHYAAEFSLLIELNVADELCIEP